MPSSVDIVTASQASFPIQVEELKASYQSRPVLNGISFQIEAGEIFGLLGPNGAGKSTCIKVLLGHKYPDSGRVRVCNNRPGKHRLSGDKRSAGWAITAECIYASAAGKT
jgi:ABC-type multidrug transport system ATPase subunit